MTKAAPPLGDDFAREPAYPPDFLFPQAEWTPLGDLDDLRFLERRLTRENLLALSYVRLQERLAFALLTMDMQNRWKRAWSEARSSNARALEDLRTLARARPAVTFVPLGALDALRTLYPDPGVRPTSHLEVLVEPATSQQDAQSALAADTPLRLVTTPVPRRSGIDAREIVAHARPAKETAPPAFTGLQVTQEAPRLTRDATRTAQEAAQPEAPARPKKREDRPREAQVTPSGEDDQDPDNLRLMPREHLLLLALVRWGCSEESERRGLDAWEIGEMSRRFAVDGARLVSLARSWRCDGIAGAALAELQQTWRVNLPDAVRNDLLRRPVAAWATRLLGPRKAQRLLRVL